MLVVSKQLGSSLARWSRLRALLVCGVLAWLLLLGVVPAVCAQVGGPGGWIEVEVARAAGMRPLGGTLVEARSQTVRLRVTEAGWTVTQVTLEPPVEGGADTAAFEALAGARFLSPQAVTADIGIGVQALVVTATDDDLGTADRTTRVAFLGIPADGGSLLPGVRRDIIEDAASGLRFEAETLLVAFPAGATAEVVSETLAGLPLVPESWFAELALVRGRILDGSSPLDWVQRPIPPGAISLTPNLEMVEEAVVGERMPKRLRDAYQAQGNADCSRTGTALRGCFDRGRATGDPLPAFRYHFLYDTFAAHRLAEHILAPIDVPAAIGIAIIDQGLGDGERIPVDIPGNALFNVSVDPLFGVRDNLIRRIRPVSDPPNPQQGRQECRDNPNQEWRACAFGVAQLTDRPTDKVRSHGTKVTVAAAGRAIGAKGVLGTGPRARIRPIVRGRSAFDTAVAVYAATIDPGVHVINTSFGTKRGVGVDGDFTAARIEGLLRNVVQLVRANDKIWVAAAGNDSVCTDTRRAGSACGNRAVPQYPADLAPGPEPRTAMAHTVMSVGASATVEALTGPEQLVRTSNYGPRISVVAGGGDVILRDRGGDLVSASGTSFAAPAVAGLAADMIRLNRSMPGARRLSALQIIEIIEATADDLGATSATHPFLNDDPANRRDVAFGHGRINTWKALLAVANGGLDRVLATGRATEFPSLISGFAGDDTWFGFAVSSPVHDASVWLDGRRLEEPAIFGFPRRAITAEKGVESNRVIVRGVDMNRDFVPDDDPTRGIVPVGNAAGEYIATFSLQRRDLVCGRRFCTLSLRRPGEDLSARPFFSLQMELDAMMDGRVPGVVYDDFVFAIAATDFGDAPDHATRLIQDNGARTLNSSLEWLGAHPRSGVPATATAPAGVSAEPNAEFELFGPNARVDRDGVVNLAGMGDADGADHGLMFFPRTYVPGGLGQVEFTVCVAQRGARYANTDDRSLWVNGWIDWSSSDSFDEGANEHVVDGISIDPRTWRVRRGNATRTAQAGNCATFRHRFPVPAIVIPRNLWARFRVDYGENVGRNDPRTVGPRMPTRGFRSDPSLRRASQMPEATDPGGVGLATGATRFGEVEDYRIGMDYGDALDPRGDDPGRPGRYPTRHESGGGYSFAFSREWLGPSARIDVSTEIDACDNPRNAADEDIPPNLGADCSLENRDERDAGVALPPRVNPGQTIDVGITVSAAIGAFGFSNRGAAPAGAAEGTDSADVQTLKPDCRLRAIEDAPDTPASFRVAKAARYAAHDPRRRLYLSAWADWNADGDWQDEGETVLDALPVDPEDFGKDGRYTLGEPFEDVDRDGVFTEGVDRFVPAMHDVAGLRSRTFNCPVRVPIDVALGDTYYWRVRLAYGQGSSAAAAQTAGVIHHNELVAGQVRNLAGPRGGSLWGEVEDHPQDASCTELDRGEESRFELRIRRDGGAVETIGLDGWSEWKVEVCDLLDEDGDGFEEVVAHLAGAELTGRDERWGDMRARLLPIDGSGVGIIEERVNRTPGVLDLPPFSPNGSAMARFDLALDLTLGERRLRLPMIGIEEEILFKPPRLPEERFVWRFDDATDKAASQIRLLDETGAPTEVEVLEVVFMPAARAPMRANQPPLP